MSPLSIVITILVIVLILMLLRYIFADPYTLQNIQDGKTASTIEASSLATNGSDVPSSNFAYSVWFYINDWNYRYGEPKVIFGRMTEGSKVKEPCPTVVLGANQNNISVSLAVYPNENTKPKEGTKFAINNFSVANIPIQKWVNLFISVYGRTMDIYIDGKLVRTCILDGVAAIDSVAPVYITPGGGFSGWTSTFQYWSDSSDPQKAWDTYKKGYGSSMLSGIFGKYTVKVSLMEGDVENSSYSI